jgi:hypothetical protein
MKRHQDADLLGKNNKEEGLFLLFIHYDKEILIFLYMKLTKDDRKKLFLLLFSYFFADPFFLAVT